MEVSTVCMGCWALGGDRTWGPQDKTDAIAAIHAAMDVGINFFDTATGYGNSELLVGEALRDRREEVVIATKVGGRNLTAEKLPAACEQSLTNLGIDCIDVYHIHWPSRRVSVDETVRAMEDLKAAGKIRHIAVSNFGPENLSELLPLTIPAANQLAYSLLFRAIEFEILPACLDGDVAVTCYSPLMQGLLTGKFGSADDVPDGRLRTRIFNSDRADALHGEAGAEKETFAAIAEIAEVARQAGMDMAVMSLAWLLGREGVASVIAGARSPDQIRRNAAAGDLILPANVSTRLDEVTEPLRETMGANADMWEPQSASPIR